MDTSRFDTLLRELQVELHDLQKAEREGRLPRNAVKNLVQKHFRLRLIGVNREGTLRLNTDSALLVGASFATDSRGDEAIELDFNASNVNVVWEATPYAVAFRLGEA